MKVYSSTFCESVLNSGTLPGVDILCVHIHHKVFSISLMLVWSPFSEEWYVVMTEKHVCSTRPSLKTFVTFFYSSNYGNFMVPVQYHTFLLSGLCVDLMGVTSPWCLRLRLNEQHCLSTWWEMTKNQNPKLSWFLFGAWSCSWTCAERYLWSSSVFKYE